MRAKRDGDAIREFFAQRAHVSRRRLRELFRRGRTSLVIGITFLAVSLVLGDIVARLLGEQRVGEIVRDSLLIGGWVAMWRPMEVFLYDWWPILGVAALFAVGQTTEAYILTPKLVGDRVGLHPVWVIFALLAGGALFGFLGVLLAMPAAAVIGVLTRFALARYLASPYYDESASGAPPGQTPE